MAGLLLLPDLCHQSSPRIPASARRLITHVLHVSSVKTPCVVPSDTYPHGRSCQSGSSQFLDALASPASAWCKILQCFGAHMCSWWLCLKRLFSPGFAAKLLSRYVKEIVSRGRARRCNLCCIIWASPNWMTPGLQKGTNLLEFFKRAEYGILIFCFRDEHLWLMSSWLILMKQTLFSKCYRWIWLFKSIWDKWRVLRYLFIIIVSLASI